MRTILIGLAAGLVMSLTAWTGMASAYGSYGYGQYQGRYECNGSESRLSGTVEKLPGEMLGTWQVDGREISVTGDTLIKERLGKAKVGAYVQIDGTCRDKALDASRIQVRSID